MIIQDYYTRTERNIGIISIEDQEILKNKKVLILGVGGLGGPLAINLVYAGCENILISDFDKIELSNLNRQPYSIEDIGKYKVDSLEAKIKQINPNTKIKKSYGVFLENLDELIINVDIVVLSMDNPALSVIVARKAREKNIPMVEGWGLPFISATWFTSESMSYEEYYKLEDLPSNNSKLLNNKYQEIIKSHFIKHFLSFENIENYYKRDSEKLKEMLSGQISFRSFAPLIWLESMYLSFEVIFAGLLKIKPINIAPSIIAYDFFSNKIIIK